MELLKYRKEVDFTLLMKMGRISHQDIHRLKDDANLSETRLPAFMNDMKVYHKRLDYILMMNGLTDDDLTIV